MAEGRIELTSTKPWAGYITYKTKAYPAKNSTGVDASCYVYRTDSNVSFGNNPYWGKMWIGTRLSTFDFRKIDGNELYVGSCWAEIPHDSQGLAKVSIGAILYGSDSNDLKNSTLEGSRLVELDPIAQAGPSPITLNTKVQQMGKKVLISLEPDQPDCIHELQYSFCGASGVVGTKVGTSCQWTVPDLAAFCGLEGLCTITCRTFFKDRDLGTSQAELTLQVPDPAGAEVSQAVLGTETEIRTGRLSRNFNLEISLILNQQEYAVGRGSSDSFSWTPPYSLAKVLPDLTVMKGLLRVRTRNGEAEVGVKDSPISLTVPENEHTRPRIQDLKLFPKGPDNLVNYGYLRGKTGLKAEITAVSDCSEPAEYHLEAGTMQAEGNPGIIEILEDSGTLRVTAAVRDLRGFEGSLSREIQVIPYEKPRVIPAAGEKTVICRRADAQGTILQSGTCLRIRAGVRFTKIGEKNRGSLSFRIRRGEEPFGAWKPLPLSEAWEGDSLLTEPELDLKHSYQVELMAEDSLGEKTVTGFSVLSQAVSFSLYDGTDGAAFGKYSEAAHVVDVAEHMTLLVRGRLELRGEQWQDLGLAPGIRPAAVPHGSVEGAKLRLGGGNHVILAFSCRMPLADQAVNLQPIPESLRPASEIAGLSAAEGGMVQVLLGTDGFLRISPLLGKEDPGWIDGTLEYWK